MAQALTRFSLGLSAFSIIVFGPHVVATVGDIPAGILGCASGAIVGRAIGRWAATGW